MEKIDGFIRENAEELRVLFPATDELVKAAESAMGVELGPQLRKYVMRYGLILYDGYEVYSMNSRAGISSNMIVETIKMHKTDQNTRDLIVIDYDEEVGGIFVDSNDNVYNFFPGEKRRRCNIKFSDYVFETLEECRLERIRKRTYALFWKYIEEKSLFPLDKTCPSQSQISEASDTLKMLFGFDLRKYLSELGILNYAGICLYGMTREGAGDRDIVNATKMLWKKYPKTRAKLLLENRENGVYILVDSGDDIWKYHSKTNILEETGKEIYGYILARLNSREAIEK